MKKKVFTAPGTLEYTGTQEGVTIISAIEYDKDTIKEYENVKITELSKIADSGKTLYIEVKNVCNTGVIEKLGKEFNIHRLVLEDILSVNQRAKMEEYNEYLYVSAYGMRDAHNISSEMLNVSLILKDNVVIVLIDGNLDYFNAVKDRIRNSTGVVRDVKADYLFYILLDTIIDSFYGYVQNLDEKSEEIENMVITDTADNIVDGIYHMKRQLIAMKKILWPTRDMILKMNSSRRFDNKTLLYIRDLTDNALHLLETIESLRDVMSGLLDLYLTQISNRMNSVMKVLTIIATIFIPLTFVAGIYGMNFVYMPELSYRWSYPAIWILMISIFSGMLIFFKKKKWF